MPVMIALPATCPVLGSAADFETAVALVPETAAGSAAGFALSVVPSAAIAAGP